MTDKGKPSKLQKALAALCHAQWSNWMQHLFSKGVFNEDGSWTMPVESVSRRKRQMDTHYSNLPQDEQASDISEANKFILVIKNNLF